MSAHRLMVLATRSRGKIAELEALLEGLAVRVEALPHPEPFATFRENAAHKALTASRLTGEWALGEDSGLCVDALGGRPGVYSSRFAGESAPDERRVALLLDMLGGVPPERRTARFHCALALAAPSGLLGQWEGFCEGRIAEVPRGEHGFGYDPVFIAVGQLRTNAELSLEEKNALSHRGQALRRLREALPDLLSRAAGDRPANPGPVLPTL